MSFWVFNRAFPLTQCTRRGIITRHWHPQARVNSFPPMHREEHYERLQPHGGRRFETSRQDDQRLERAPGERNPGVHQVSQQRSRPSGAHALHKSAPGRVEEAVRVRRLHGPAPDQVTEISTRSPAVCPTHYFSFVMILILLLSILFLASCGHPKQAKVSVPPPPTLEATESQPVPSVPPAKESTPRRPATEENADPAEPTLPADAKPLLIETGLASWYGPPYHNRRGSNGEVYNMHAMTAAHRTFPLGSIVRITNVKTGATALVRITDRGPFIPGRVLDLSLAAARKIDVYQPGVAEVKVELMQAAAPLVGGKW